MSFLGASLESGVKIIFDETNLEGYIKNADVVVTGEGCLDFQSVMGKAPIFVDKYAKHKFEALKDYASRYPNVKWGFVRAVGTQLYLSNTVWDENVTNRNVWKPIECFI